MGIDRDRFDELDGESRRTTRGNSGANALPVSVFLAMCFIGGALWGLLDCFLIGLAVSYIGGPLSQHLGATNELSVEELEGLKQLIGLTALFLLGCFLGAVHYIGKHNTYDAELVLHSITVGIVIFLPVISGFVIAAITTSLF